MTSVSKFQSGLWNALSQSGFLSVPVPQSDRDTLMREYAEVIAKMENLYYAASSDRLAELRQRRAELWASLRENEARQRDIHARIGDGQFRANSISFERLGKAIALLNAAKMRDLGTRFPSAQELAQKQAEIDTAQAEVRRIRESVASLETAATGLQRELAVVSQHGRAMEQELHAIDKQIAAFEAPPAEAIEVAEGAEAHAA